MLNPFKAGDAVYHPSLGKGNVTDQVTYNNEQNICVVFERKVYSITEDFTVIDANLLSFSPWPEPNHTRPFVPTLAQETLIYFRNSTSSGVGKVLAEYEHSVLLASQEVPKISFLKTDTEFYTLSKVEFKNE